MISLPPMIRRLARRKLLAAALALCALPQLLAPTATAQGRRPQRRRPAASPASAAAAQDARVAQLADEYLRGHYAFNPTAATAAGLHEFDAQLESRGAEAIAAEVRRLKSALAALARVRESALSAEARYDFLWLQSRARADLLELEEVRRWQRDPGLYAGLLAASFDHVLKRNYAPVGQRLDALLARSRSASRLLSEARANLQNPPRLHTEMGLARTAGAVEFFARSVPRMFLRAGGGRLPAARRAEFDAAVESVLDALRLYADWLRRDLLARSDGDFRVGGELLRRKLLYEEMIDTPLPALVRDGERELRRTQERMRRAAEEIAPARDVREVLRALERDRPTAGGLVGETRSALDRVRAFVRAQNILTPPAGDDLIVAETPEYARGDNFASSDAAGLHERGAAAAESFFYVTPPGDTWDARRREEHLSSFHRHALPLVAIREAFPGRHYQLLALRRTPSRARAALPSAGFAEGWAHYSEEMMLDEGFGGGEPRFRLAQLHSALTQLCRHLVGLRMHAEGMTHEQAVDFFIREGYLERAGAEREARRSAFDPGGLVAALGKMEIVRLREDYRRARGDSFNLGEFHDRLLSHGGPPVKILRMALLSGANATAGTPASPAETGAGDDRTNVVESSVVAFGAYSAHEGGRTIELVSDEAAWRRAWDSIGGGRRLPEVNFVTRSVVLVFQGQKPTGGYSVSVEEIRRDGTALAVRVNERRPASGDITAQVITSPFVAVSVPRPAAGTSVRFADAGAPADEAGPGPQNRKRIVTPRARRTARRRGGRKF